MIKTKRRAQPVRVQLKQYRLSAIVFDTAVGNSRMKGKALAAARQSLVDGVLPIKAALNHDVSKQSVSACIRRVLNNALKLGACPCCGRVIESDIVEYRA